MLVWRDLATDSQSFLPRVASRRMFTEANTSRLEETERSVSVDRAEIFINVVIIVRALHRATGRGPYENRIVSIKP